MRTLFFMCLLFLYACGEEGPPSYSGPNINQNTNTPIEEKGKEGEERGEEIVSTDIIVTLKFSVPEMATFKYYSDKSGGYTEKNHIFTFSNDKIIVKLVDGIVYYIPYKITASWQAALLEGGGQVFSSQVEDGQQNVYDMFFMVSSIGKIEDIKIGERLFTNRKLVPEQEVEGPLVIKIKEGYNLNYISKKYGVSVAQLIALNPHIKNRTGFALYINEEITVQ